MATRGRGQRVGGMGEGDINLSKSKIRNLTAVGGPGKNLHPGRKDRAQHFVITEPVIRKHLSRTEDPKVTWLLACLPL